MSALNIRKVSSFPATPEANTIYIQEDGTNAEMRVTTSSGAYRKFKSAIIPTLDNVLSEGNETQQSVIITDNNNYSNSIGSDGIFSNGSGETFFAGTTGITTNASVVGLLQARNNDSIGISAAVAGIDQTTAGNSKSSGGYFDTVRLTKHIYNLSGYSARTNATSYYIDEERFVSFYGGTATIYLPSNPAVGRIVTVACTSGSGTRTLDGNGTNIRYKSNTAQSSFTMGWVHTLIYDGYWWIRVNEVI